MATANRRHETVCANGISRRRFLKLAGAAGACAALGGVGGLSGLTKLDVLPRPRAAKAASGALVAGGWIPRGEHRNSAALFRRVVEAATDFSWLSPGDRVFIKLSLNSGNPYPASTDPWALNEMIRMLQEKGAGRIIVGDKSGPGVNWTPPERRGSSRQFADTAGLLPIILENGAEATFFEERGWDAYVETSPSGEHHWPVPLLVTDVVEEVDHIIYMPRVGSHGLGEATLGIKLAVGFLRDDIRRVFHSAGGENFYRMYEEINHVPEIESRRRLIVSTGWQVLSMGGPNAGSITEPDYGLLFASEDLLAHEMLSYAWLQWNREVATPAEALAAANRTMRSTYRAGDIYQHPAVSNLMERLGLSEPNFGWEQVNQGPSSAVLDYLRGQMKI
ncbi:MAG: DUF362 domain-containing protein [Chloroflexi bacterium]|nr:DUF362 domain-containing protein [Chloroflexota bacterium]